MPTLGAMLLGDVKKATTLEENTGARPSKKKRKSLAVIGKNADWTGSVASNAAWKSSDAANEKDSKKAHAKASTAHKRAAKLAMKAGNFGIGKLHEAQAKVHDDAISDKMLAEKAKK